MWHLGMASNMNFPSPIAAMGFIGACMGTFLAVCGIIVALFVRKARIAKRIAMVVGVGVLSYSGLLLALSLSSREIDLAKGQEKYFCEIDCHLAYSVLEVKSESGPNVIQYLVSLRTRFDETTISPRRPKDAPLSPSPRTVQLIDSSGRTYIPDPVAGKELSKPLIPGESYETQLRFKVPPDAHGLKLLIRTTPQWPDYVVIGDENSWLHQKTYFAL